MINFILNKIPSCNVSISDFPYLEDYYEYITKKIISRITLDDIQKPNLIVKDTPYLESHFLEHDNVSTIVFDVSASFLIINFTSVLLNGAFTREAWLSLLTAGVNQLTKLGYAHIGVSLALNRAWDLRDALFKSSVDHPLITLDNVFWGEHGKQSANIQCQEMFILAHEVTHYFISKDIYNLKSVTRTIYDDLIKARAGDISTKVFFAKVLGSMPEHDEDNKSFYKEARKELFSQSFREEILCDLNAAEITIEYFTWDRGSMQHEEVCASIQVAIRSLMLAGSLRNHLRSLANIDNANRDKRRLEVQFLLRAKVLDAFFSKVIKNKVLSFNSSNNDEAIKRIVDYDIIYFENLRKRTAVIETCFFGDIIRTIGELEEAYVHIDPHISDPETSALHYLGYKNMATKSDEFMRTDGSIFYRNPGLHGELEKTAKVNLYKISDSSIEKAKELMEAAVW